MKFKAVIFDLYETLISEFADGSRKSDRSYDYMELLGISNEDFQREWRLRRQKRMSGEFPIYHSVVKEILEKYDLPYKHKEVEKLYQERLNEKVIPFLEIRTDIIELLDELKKREVRLGLISNCTEEEVRYWRHSELASYFDDAVFSYEVQMAKPDERIYQRVCQRLLADPEDSLYVGDGGAKELEGASQAGLTPLQAYWFSTNTNSEFKKIDQPFDILKEL